MKLRILRYQLLTLFILSILGTVFFCCKESMPDHLFSVSSSNSSYFISYYSASIFALAGYYIGPWISVLFLAFAIFYAAVFARRDYIFDQFAILFFAGTILAISYFFSPELIGDALYYNLSVLSILWKVLFTLIFVSLTMLVVFRSSIRSNFFAFYMAIRNVMRKMSQIISRKDVKSSPRNVQFKTGASKISNLRGNFSMLATKLLRGGSDSSKVSSSTSIKPVPLKVLAPPAFLQQSSSVQGTIISDSVLEKDVQNKGYFRPLQSSGSDDHFNISELVDCITVTKKKPNIDPDSQYFDEIINRIEEKLAEFNLEASIINILKGPVVDTFELELGPGVKVSKITSIHEDLSLTLCGVPIRIVYPMRGKTTVGIEVPRNPREVVYLDEVLRSETYMDLTQKLPIVMGKNAFGEISIIDLTKMPHMLVAGATGSGKSVFINTLLVSLLVKMPPSKMKLILIDPKQLELALYARLPHLVMPVVTDAKMASVSLLWAVQEMERRYSILKEMRVRSIDGFNEKVRMASNEELMLIHHYYEDQEEGGYELPYIVVIIDEFADLMLTKVGKEIEGNVCRLAAKARAAGIHLIIATQRPSVDVITGLIKSNFPTRISFKVASAVDSRTILNSMGGEKLLGNGDMLYKHGVEMERLHSAYVDESEIEVLVERIGVEEQDFSESVVNFLENGGDDPDISGGASFGDSGDESVDSLYQAAVEVVSEHNQASASFLQRRLRIGYNRAANLIDTLEARGVIGPAQGSKPREVLTQ